LTDGRYPRSSTGLHPLLGYADDAIIVAVEPRAARMGRGDLIHQRPPTVRTAALKPPDEIGVPEAGAAPGGRPTGEQRRGSAEEARNRHPAYRPTVFR